MGLFNTNIQYLLTIQLMVSSGCSLDESVHLLTKKYPNNSTIQQVKYQLENGVSPLVVIKLFAPWWSPYPFNASMSDLQLSNVLDAYLTVVNRRKTSMIESFELCRYPLILTMASMSISWFCLTILMPTMSSVLNQNDELLRQVSMSLTLIVGVVLLAVVGFVWAIVQLIRVSDVDALEIVALSCKHGASLAVVCTQLNWPKRWANRFQNVMNELIETGNIIESFGTQFYISDVVRYMLQSYESSGQWVDGLCKSLPIIHREEQQRVFVFIRVIQFVLYGCVLGMIVCMLVMLYAPLVGISK